MSRALPLLSHCLVHLVLALALILLIAPRFWFIAFIESAIHIVVDRAKGICVSAFNVTHQHPWFWTLIGVDQTLHHQPDSVWRSSWHSTRDLQT